jgi:hypothetical protein
MTLTINPITTMKIIDIMFLTANDNKVSAHLYYSTEDSVCESVFSVGVSRKQAIFNLCKEGKLDWSLFAEAKELAMTKKDPRFQKKTFVSRNSVRDQKLADICDDMRCSVAEAVAFLDRGVAPCGW